MTLADRPATPPPPVGRVPCLVLLLLLAGLAAAAFYMLGRARFRFTNQLVAPVKLKVGEEPARMLAPGETVVLPVSRRRTLVAQWEMEQPLSADGQPMGEPIAGAVVVRGPRGTVADSADTVDGEVNYFAPLITNATSGPLRVTVNAGLQSPLDCGCAVRPGARRAFIGYYRLYGNSTVRARGPAGEATFRDLGPQVTTRDGTVGLRFEDRDLRRARR